MEYPAQLTFMHSTRRLFAGSHYGMPEQVNLNSNCRVAHNALCTATAKSMES